MVVCKRKDARFWERVQVDGKAGVQVGAEARRVPAHPLAALRAAALLPTLLPRLTLPPWLPTVRLYLGSFALRARPVVSLVSAGVEAWRRALVLVSKSKLDQRQRAAGESGWDPARPVAGHQPRLPRPPRAAASCAALRCVARHSPAGTAAREGAHAWPALRAPWLRGRHGTAAPRSACLQAPAPL